MIRAVLATLAVAVALSSPALAQNATQVARVTETGVSCPGCDLLQIELSYQSATNRNYAGARLMQAGMTAGIYDGTNFRGANMRFLEGSASRFSQADFSNADLSQAALVGSYFGGARFNRANLAGANLSGSDFSTARGLTQSQLDQACGDAETLLPPGLSVPFCR
jgi:uncharacterized protein YjbI with pentapeptide repeats